MSKNKERWLKIVWMVKNKQKWAETFKNKWKVSKMVGRGQRT